MNSTPFEKRLEAERRTSRHSAILTVVGVLMIVSAGVGMLWQYQEARSARDAAAQAEVRAQTLKTQYEDLSKRYEFEYKQLSGQLMEAAQKQAVLQESLKALTPTGADENKIKEIQAKGDEFLGGLETAGKKATDNIRGLNEVSKAIKRSDPQEQATTLQEPPPVVVPAGKAVLQFVVGSEEAKAKLLSLRSRMGEGYSYTNVVVAKRVPSSTEVRYYYLPGDQAEAQRIWQELKEKFHVSKGRISYVVDPDQPKRFFQIAVANDALP